MTTLPDAIHVGFSKSASTFLRAFFLQHPQVFLVSDAHFFAPFENCNYSSGTSFYANLFRNASQDQRKVESDEHIVLPLLHPVLRAAATTLDAVEEVAQRIKSTAPDAKIILVIRNQLDLILSRYGEYIMEGRDLDFENFVDEFLNERHTGTNYYQNFYSRILETFNRFFSPDRVLVLLQEELYRDEQRVIGQLCSFLRIEPFRHREAGGKPGKWFSMERLQVVARSGPHSKNTGLSYCGIKVMRLWNKAVVIEAEEAHYRKVRARVPFGMYKFGVRAIRLLDYYLPRRFKGDKRKLLNERIVGKIGEWFNEDNERLAKLLGRDLTLLGYSWNTAAAAQRQC